MPLKRYSIIVADNFHYMDKAQEVDLGRLQQPKKPSLSVAKL